MPLRDHNPEEELRQVPRWARRAAASAMEHPGAILLGAFLAGGVVAGALWAGFKLRQYRFAKRTPYDVHYTRKDNAAEYEAVGI